MNATMKQINKAEQSCIKYQTEQLRMINCTCFIALYRLGWDADKIVERFNDATEIWQECRAKHTSTFAMLEEETGIELALDGEKSYTEFDQLKFGGKDRTPSEYIYSLHRRKRWVAPMMLSCMLLALHRVDDWSDEQMGEFIRITDEIRKANGEVVQNYVNMMISETGFTPRLWGE